MMASDVADGRLGLHDDPHLLVTEDDLRRGVPGVSSERVREMVETGLALPVWGVGGEPRFHALNCSEFAAFADKMAAKGIPVELQRVVAERWYTKFMSLIQDVEYELAEAAKEAGRPLTAFERALVRVINEYVVGNQVCNWEQAILENTKESWEPDDVRGLLDRLKDKAAERARPATRSALHSVGEQIVGEMVAAAWKRPRGWYQKRGIKDFLDANDKAWTRAERDLIWKGHFDFALCDERGHIQAAVEYDGPGHYGKTAAEGTATRRRDQTKDRICRKAGIPLLRLTDHYLYTEEKQLACQMLRLLARSASIAPRAAQAVREELQSIRASLSDLEHRLDIYEKQGPSSAIVGLVWQLPTKLQRVRALQNLFRKLG